MASKYEKAALPMTTSRSKTAVGSAHDPKTTHGPSQTPGSERSAQQVLYLADMTVPRAPVAGTCQLCSGPPVHGHVCSGGGSGKGLGEGA